MPPLSQCLPRSVASYSGLESEPATSLLAARTSSGFVGLTATAVSFCGPASLLTLRLVRLRSMDTGPPIRSNVERVDGGAVLIRDLLAADVRLGNRAIDPADTTVIRTVRSARTRGRSVSFTCAPFVRSVQRGVRRHEREHV